MGILTPDPTLDQPQAIRDYVAAKQRVLGLGFDLSAYDDPAWAELERCDRALVAELKRWGGKFAVGTVVFELDPKGRGITIFTDVATHDATEAKIKEDMSKVRKRFVLRRIRGTRTTL